MMPAIQSWIPRSARLRDHARVPLVAGSVAIYRTTKLVLTVKM